MDVDIDSESEELFEGIDLDELEQQAQSQVQKQNHARESIDSIEELPFQPASVSDKQSFKVQELEKQLLIRSGENSILRSNLQKQSEQHNRTIEALNAHVKSVQEEYQSKIRNLEQEIERVKTESCFFEKEAQDATLNLKKLQKLNQQGKNESNTQKNTSTDIFQDPAAAFHSNVDDWDPLPEQIKVAVNASATKKKKKRKLSVQEGVGKSSSSVPRQNDDPQHEATIDLLCEQLVQLEQQNGIWLVSRGLGEIYGGLLTELSALEDEEGQARVSMLTKLIYDPVAFDTVNTYVQSLIQLIEEIFVVALKKSYWSAAGTILTLSLAIMTMEPDMVENILQSKIPSLANDCACTLVREKEVHQVAFERCINFLCTCLYNSSALTSNTQLQSQVSPMLFERCIDFQQPTHVIKLGLRILMSSIKPSAIACVPLVNPPENDQRLVYGIFSTLSRILADEKRAAKNHLEFLSIHDMVLQLLLHFYKQTKPIGLDVLQACSPLVPSFALATCWYLQLIQQGFQPTESYAQNLVNLLRITYLVAPSDLSTRLVNSGHGLLQRYVAAVASCTYGDLEYMSFQRSAKEVSTLSAEILELCVSPEELDSLYTLFDQ
ncbi:hypothetical protein SJAG_00429 [Schizosaccharomyces japonicus yFS275]|uniref:DNA repair protein Rad26 n=1 Tax=Schizosaccharomyces japonicus (strain yFS275 / FY16936) TaxID=402676 RepID=B6JVL5_SCHJY|nr:hypothetical protein SJAG_00429 [Schizosaccharomyces japonicus yFS275]EEB05416.1 hypothetical protein SJAG_00429 [Schizosaccharomyces japonicus yFS275]